MPRNVKQTPAGVVISHIVVKYNDHMTSVTNGVQREKLGKAIGKVCRPTALSPMTSWKSCA